MFYFDEGIGLATKLAVTLLVSSTGVITGVRLSCFLRNKQSASYHCCLLTSNKDKTLSKTGFVKTATKVNLMPDHLAVESSLVPLTTALLLLFLFSASKAADCELVVDELDDCRRRKSEAVGRAPGLGAAGAPGLLTILGAAAACRTGDVGKEPWPESTEEMLEWRIESESVLDGNWGRLCIAGFSIGSRVIDRAFDE